MKAVASVDVSPGRRDSTRSGTGPTHRRRVVLPTHQSAGRSFAGGVRRAVRADT
jgi:hypothetical protein